MEDEDDEFGQLYTDVLPWLSSSPNPPQQPLSSSAIRASVVDTRIKHEQSLYRTTNDQTLVSDHETPLKIHFHSAKYNVTGTNLDNKNRVESENEEQKELEYKEFLQSRVSNGNSNGTGVLRNSDGLYLSETEPIVEIKNSDVEENLEFEMGFVEKEKEIEAGILNVQRLDAGLDVIGDLKDSGEGWSFAEPAKTMGIDIDIDNLDFGSILPELMSGTCIENVLENGENEVAMRGFHNGNDCGIGVNNDEDSNNEDGLNIILTDDDNSRWVGVNEYGVGMDDKVKGGEDLFLVADNDQCNEGVDKEWPGADLADVVDGERKQTSEETKGRRELGNAVQLTIGFPDHSCHFEGVRSVAVTMLGRAPVGSAGAPGWAQSSFNCVRPVAASIPGGASIGHGRSPHIPSFVNVRPVADHGRADWQPTAIKSSNSMHHISHASLVGSAWGNKSSAHVLCKRLDFMLPSHMTVFDINIDHLEEKRWRHPGVDLSDFFNFGLDELKWKDYCRQMEQLHLDSMRSTIIIYESRRPEQNNDQDLPPELATATSSHDLLAENPFRRTDATREKLLSEGMETAPKLSPIPIGQAIQVEVGIGERFPSIDVRRPQLRDSDAIIEIVLQDYVDVTDAEREKFKKDVAQLDTKTYNGFPHSCNIQLTRVHKNVHGGGIWPFPLDSSRQFRLDCQHYAGIFGTPHEERKLQNNEKTDDMEGRKVASDMKCPSETLEDESLILSVKNPRLSSQFIPHVDEMKSRHKRNLQENEENYVNVYSRKNLKNHNWSDHEKNLSPKHGRNYFTLTDHNKCKDYTHARRKGGKYMRRKYEEEEKVLHGYKSKREKCDASGQRRNDQPRIRDRPDNLHSIEYQKDSWWQESRNDRERLRQPHENNQSEQVRRERRAGSCHRACKDHSASASDSQDINIERQRIKRKREGSKKGYQLTISPTKRNHVNCRSYCNEKVRVESSSEQTRMRSLTTDIIDSCDPERLKSPSATFTKHHEQETINQYHFSGKQREDATTSTGQRDFKRGRSKLERWTSHDKWDEDWKGQEGESSS